MRIKAVSSLVGGEVLAEPILTEKNDILIPNGTRIKPDYVPLIESLGIESVMVEDPYENYESPNSIVDPAIFDKYVIWHIIYIMDNIICDYFKFL